MELLNENISHEDLKKYIKELYNYASKELNIDVPPRVFLRRDKTNAEDILGKTGRKIPAMYNYQVQIEGGSMYNTPPCFAIYVSMLTLKWLKSKGGVPAIEKENNEKARVLYEEIDRNPLFKAVAAPEDRSRMNVCFVMENAELEKPFLKFCDEKGIVGIKGHRSVGGFRASIYNALPITSVYVLIDAMREFAEKNK